MHACGLILEIITGRGQPFGHGRKRWFKHRRLLHILANIGHGTGDRLRQQSPGTADQFNQTVRGLKLVPFALQLLILADKYRGLPDFIDLKTQELTLLVLIRLLILQLT